DGVITRAEFESALQRGLLETEAPVGLTAPGPLSAGPVRSSDRQIELQAPWARSQPTAGAIAVQDLDQTMEQAQSELAGEVMRSCLWGAQDSNRCDEEDVVN
ncbi:unnamed protein product, partial [Polarella glacialis]